jgi:PAS domain S-box-containing protein
MTPRPLPGSSPLSADVSDRARAEQALRESEERYRSLVESAHDPIFSADAGGRFLYVNRAAAAIFGLKPEEVEGRTVDELFPPPVAERYRAGVRRVIDSGETLSTEDHFDVNGQPRWFSTIVQPMRAADGGIVAAQAIVREITARKLAEDRLRRSEERLNQAIRIADIGIFDHDHLTDEALLVAGAAAHRRPRTTESLPRQSEHRRARQRALDSPRRSRGGSSRPVSAPTRRRSDGFYDVEYRFFRPDGEFGWAEGAVRRRSSGARGDARHPGARPVGGAQDVTESKAGRVRAHPAAGAAHAGAEDGVVGGRLAGGGGPRLQQPC